MGWDVVEIGLKHDLPVNDPYATAQEVTKRMKQNVRLVYRNEYEYDIAKNVVKEAEGDEFIELGKYEVNNSKDYLQMIVSDYQAHQILESVGIDKLRLATFEGEFAESILDDIEDPFELYEIEDKKDCLDIRIFKENVICFAFFLHSSFFHSSNHVVSFRYWYERAYSFRLSAE